MTSQKQALAADPIPNQPMGIAKGIFPGRVVWVHDPNATDWEGPESDDGYSWQPENTPQKYVDAMVSRAIRELTGKDYDADAWDAMFRYFNIEHGKGDIGYAPGEKITIKINLTTTNSGSNMNLATYDKTSYLDKSDTSPQVALALIHQLVYEAGIDPNAIAIGDTLCHYPNQWRNPVYEEFPAVVFFDARGEMGRTLSVDSPVQQYWSELTDPNDYTPDYIPALYEQADYLINLPVLKGHAAGITLCAKNHYGSYNRRPDTSSFYPLHDSLAGTGYQDSGRYRALVDIMGHPDMGDKTLLYMIDGLYGGYYWRGTPRRFEQPLFNNDWPSSILVSLDPVAIDSVGLDILWEEWPLGEGDYVVQVPGVEDYLIEAALADNPPSGTFYDPDGDGVRLASLGVHERWNNPIDKQYSRNLGTGNGIELQYIKLNHYPGDLNSDDYVGIEDLMQLIEQWLWTGDSGAIIEDIVEDGSVNLEDFSVISENWGSPF